MVARCTQHIAPNNVALASCDRLFAAFKNISETSAKKKTMLLPLIKNYDSVKYKVGRYQAVKGYYHNSRKTRLEIVQFNK